MLSMNLPKGTCVYVCAFKFACLFCCWLLEGIELVTSPLLSASLCLSYCVSVCFYAYEVLSTPFIGR